MNLVNGQPSDSIPVNDRGLHYGDGIFETIAVHKGKPLALVEHVTRLLAGAESLGFPVIDVALLLNEISTLFQEDRDCILKIILTRGSGGRGYRPPDLVEAVPTRILSLHDWPDYPSSMYDDGVTLCLCDTRLSINPVLAGIKHLNRLEQVLARNEWSDPEILEGIMLDTEGNVIEGTMSNLFMVIDNTLVTPALDNCGIHGITRKLVMDTAAETGMGCHVTQLQPDDLNRASEAFICNSVLGLCHVQAFQQKTFDAPSITPTLRDALVEQSKIAPP